MRLRTISGAAIAAVWVLASCAPKGQSDAVAAGKESASTTGATTSGNNGKVTSTGLSTDSIPADLKSVAYEYYGLESPKTGMKTITEPKLSGFVEYSLEKATPEEAVFRVNYSGDLQSEMGSGKVAVRKDGIYNIEQSGSAINPPALDLPNDLTPGKSWKVKLNVKAADGRTASQNTVDTVVGPTKVTVEGKTYDAVQISEKGDFTLGGTTSAVVANKWFVKGKGVVRQTIELKGKDQKRNMEIIATDKPDSGTAPAAPGPGEKK